MQTGLYIIELSGVVTNIIDSEINNTVYPNPAKHNLTIRSQNTERFILFNSLGVKVKDIQKIGSQTTITRGTLANGIYFYSLIKNDGKIESGKVLFE